MRNYLHIAIRKLRPNSEFVISDNDYSTINWIKLEGEAPTQKEVDAAIKEVKADEVSEIKAKEIQRQAILDRLGLTADELQTILG
jgi:ribosomal protein S4